MDPTAILGLCIAIWLLLSSIGIETGMKLFWDPPAMIIVFGGILGASMVHFPITQFIKLFGRLKVVFGFRRKDYQKDIEQITMIADKIRKDGRLAINKDIEKISDHFLRSSLQLFVDKVSPEQLEQIMKENINAIEERHGQGIMFFETLSKYAPGFGMVGTLIGLIIMLAKLDDPKNIGSHMSIALVTTFYGVLLSNLVFLPLAGRLRISSYEEIFQKQMLLKGIIALANGDSSYIIREKMAMFLSEKERKRLQQHMNKAKKQVPNG